MSEKNLVEVKDLKEYFPITTGFMKTTMLKAVDDVSFRWCFRIPILH